MSCWVIQLPNSFSHPGLRKQKINLSKELIIYKWWEGMREIIENLYVPTSIEKEYVWNCHVFASVIVCKLFKLQSSSTKHLGTLELILTRMLIRTLGVTWYDKVEIFRVVPKFNMTGQWCVLIGWNPRNLLFRKQMEICYYDIDLCTRINLHLKVIFKFIYKYVYGSW